jgi:bifunctional DNA-binding transcriptional regulator/antitoxin component of YhaV-PrlF toxin-antitoxin module
MHSDRGRPSPALSEPVRERLLAALVPGPAHHDAIDRPPLPALSAPQLPPLDPSTDLHLSMARLDWSGRVHQRALLQTLGWTARDTLDIIVVDTAILITPSPTGLHTLGPNTELTIPAAARHLSGIADGSRVLLAASPTQQILILHPVGTITALLRAHHAHLAQADDHDH